MKTHELEKELGISKHTIFYYEKEGIVTPQRDANGYRSYNRCLLYTSDAADD